MADLEISIQYKALSKSLFVTLCLLWAAAGVATIWTFHAVNSVLDLLFAGDFWWGFTKFIFFLASTVFYAYVPFLLLTRYSRGNHVFANKDGLGVPAALIGASRWLPWSEMQKADLIDCGFWQTLKLSFKPGGDVSLHTNRMSQESLEQLLMAIEVWAVKCLWTQPLSDFRDSLQNKKVGIAASQETSTGYTQLWEEELTRRFNTTTFVPLEPGTTLRSGAFKILRQIAFGGFSAVYLAEDRERRQVVLKESVTTTSLENTDAEIKALQFFKREATILSLLNNDRIARVLDNFVENTRTYLVLEYIPGDTLREYVKRNGAQNEETVLSWMLEMADILAYLHSQEPPVIHRDFTPDNIVLKGDGSIVLIDFGAANQFVGAATGTLVGKQSYMPPEQVRGKTEPKSDLYGLGCTAYFLLTGTDPEPLSICRPKSANDAVSTQLDELVAKLTQQEPGERTATAGDVACEVNAILAGAGIISLARERQGQLVDR